MASSDLQLETAQASPPWAVKPIAYIFPVQESWEASGDSVFCFTASNILFIEFLVCQFPNQYLIHIISFDPHKDRKSKVQYLREVIIFDTGWANQLEQAMGATIASTRIVQIP